MEFLALGPLELRKHGSVVELSRPKSRALLALLLARPNRSIPTEQLIDELWAGSPPASGETAFRVHLTHLRRVLDNDAGPSTVQSTGAGYRLETTDDRFDALRFDAALWKAREAAQAGAPEESIAFLEPALRSWRGPAFADAPDLEPVRAEAVRLDGLRLEASELLADSRLAIGDAGSACGLLEHALTLSPMRESLSERLMLALYRTGRSSDALSVFGKLRHLLDEEIGVLPGPRIRALEEAIVLQNPELDLLPAVARRGSITLRTGPPFVGRRRELDALERTWSEVYGGASRFVLIEGTAGIGKTALVEQATQRVRSTGGDVFVGNCDLDETRKWEPFPALARQIVVARAGKTPQEVLRELAPIAADLIDSQPANAAPDPATGRHRLFTALCAVFAGEHARPTMIVLEDLHWARADALSLLRALRREAKGSLLLVGTVRSEEAGASLLAELFGPGDHPDVGIRLDGLDTPELLALVRSTAPETVRLQLGPHLAELQELTAGNPLFVRETLRELAETPEARLDEIVPGGVVSLVERRLERLEPRTRAALAVGAVLGRQFSLRLLAETAALSQSDVLLALEEAVHEGLLEEGERIDLFTFCHPLIRNAVYAGIAPERRGRLHLRAAHGLEAEIHETGRGHWTDPAHHLLAAAPLGDAGHAARLAVLAGTEAAASFAHRDAATWFVRGLELARRADWPAPDEARLLLSLGRALELAGDANEARDMYVKAAARAKAAEASDLLVDVAIAATPRYITADAFQPVQAAIVNDALAVVGDDERKRSWLLCGAGSAHYYDDHENEEPYAREAIELGQRSTDPETQAACAFTQHRWLTHDPDAAPIRLEVSRELVTVCADDALQSLLGRATRTLLVDLLELDELAEFDDELTRFAAVATARGVPADIYWAATLRATRTLMRDTDEAEVLIDAAHTLGVNLEQGDADGVWFLQRLALRYQQGRMREIAGMLTAPKPSDPFPLRAHAGLAPLALAFLEAGQPDVARALLDRIVTEDELLLSNDNLWLGAVALLSAIAAQVGTAAQRATMQCALNPLADRWCVYGAGGAVFGTGHHWLAELAEASGAHADARNHRDAARSQAEGAQAYCWAKGTPDE